MKYIAYALRGIRGKGNTTAIKTIAVYLACITSIVFTLWLLASWIGAMAGCGDASWNVIYVCAKLFG